MRDDPLTYEVLTEENERHIVTFSDGVRATVEGPWVAAMEVGRYRCLAHKTSEAAAAIASGAATLADYASQMEEMARAVKSSVRILNSVGNGGRRGR